MKHLYIHVHAHVCVCADTEIKFNQLTPHGKVFFFLHSIAKIFVLTCFCPDKTGWYSRSENNGWRLVSDRLLHSAMSDPVTWDTSKKMVDFSHSKVMHIHIPGSSDSLHKIYK